MVRLVDESNNQIGIVSIEKALNMAREAGFDLVEVAPTSEPPVCRIMDYGKWLYHQKRKVREAYKKHHHQLAILKEIRFRPETSKHDLDIKIRHAREFLEKGHRVQFSIFFRGRQILHKEQGYEILDRIAASLEDLAKTEQSSKVTHKRMTLLLVPK